MNNEPIDLHLAATALRNADALLIGAGAGMGVDSGLPDFRGNDGFWQAYPMLYGRPFAQMSTPYGFAHDPAKAWGFFGHRLNLYRVTVPHEGFHILRRIAQRMPLGSFVFTSNVDGQFQKAGFPENIIYECHGSIHHLQCSAGCSRAIWSADNTRVDVDATLTAQDDLPCCPECGAVARPNIMMFNDFDWIDRRSREQEKRYEAWLAGSAGGKVVAIELGAGTAVPSVRYECQRQGNPLIRINPREHDVSCSSSLSLPMGALAALRELERLINE